MRTTTKYHPAMSQWSKATASGNMNLATTVMSERRRAAEEAWRNITRMPLVLPDIEFGIRKAEGGEEILV